MNRFLLSATLLLAVAAPALAQRTTPAELANDRRDVQIDQRQLDRARANNSPRVDDRRADLGDSRREYRDDARGVHDQRYADRDGRYGNAGNYGDGRYNNGRYDNARYDNARHGDDRRWDSGRYRAGAYYYPRGYGAQRWATGAYVPTAYWRSDRYWIANPAAYRLSAPWRDVRWLRVGPDALLIRVRTGQVVQVVRGLFY